MPPTHRVTSLGKVIEGTKLDTRFTANIRTLTVTARPERVWLSWETGLAAACLYSDRVDVHSVNGGVLVRWLSGPTSVENLRAAPMDSILDCVGGERRVVSFSSLTGVFDGNAEVFLSEWSTTQARVIARLSRTSRVRCRDLSPTLLGLCDEHGRITELELT